MGRAAKRGGFQFQGQSPYIDVSLFVESCSAMGRRRCLSLSLCAGDCRPALLVYSRQRFFFLFSLFKALRRASKFLLFRAPLVASSSTGSRLTGRAKYITSASMNNSFALETVSRSGYAPVCEKWAEVSRKRRNAMKSYAGNKSRPWNHSSSPPSLYSNCMMCHDGPAAGRRLYSAADGWWLGLKANGWPFHALIYWPGSSKRKKKLGRERKKRGRMVGTGAHVSPPAASASERSRATNGGNGRNKNERIQSGRGPARQQWPLQPQKLYRRR